VSTPSRAATVARVTTRTIGEILITLGLVVLLFCGYELWFTGVYTQAQQHRLSDELHRNWAEPDKPGHEGRPGDVPITDVPLGSGLAVMRIPALGRDYAKVVIEGVGREDLKKGPGHFPGTALPGQIGNFVVSGHRTTYGAPFNRVDELHEGDAIVVETRDTWFTYRVTQLKVVDPDAIEVTLPVPEHPGAVPNKAVLTLTTCNPKYSAKTRLIVFADLAESTPKADGLPAALKGI
jgi:sortase A